MRSKLDDDGVEQPLDLTTLTPPMVKTAKIVDDNPFA